MNNLWSLLKETFHAWHQDNVVLLAGALSFFAVFSLVPILVITIAIAGQFLGEQQAQQEIYRQATILFNPQAAHAIKSLLAGATKSSAGIASFFSGVLLIFISIRVFSQLQDALKIIWRVKEKKIGLIKSALKKRFLSFLMLIGVGLFLFLALLLDISLQLFSSSVNQWMPEIDKLLLLRFSSVVASLIVFTILCAMVYRFGPRTNVQWKDVWFGAVTASFLLLVSRYLLTFYFRWSNIITLYGAAGSIIVILLWIYFSAQIFLFGAELTWAYAYRFGSRAKSPLPE
ncbi:hypothetical protein BVX98_03840 [bacterium F11]|nr:hypothetical protein BVX98_03840 [bacterium F11]